MKSSVIKEGLLVGAVLLIGSCVGCAAGPGMNSGSSASETAEMPAVQAEDVLTEHKVVKYDFGEGIYGYETIYYGNDTHTVKAITIELAYDKEMGYQFDQMNREVVDNLFPEFAEVSCEDGEQYIVITGKMKDLDQNKEHIQALADLGIVEITEEDTDRMDADSLYAACIEDGWTDAPVSDYPILHFDL